MAETADDLGALFCVALGNFEPWATSRIARVGWEGGTEVDVGFGFEHRPPFKSGVGKSGTKGHVSSDGTLNNISEGILQEPELEKGALAKGFERLFPETHS